jgi:3-methyladenine DNA glycosylase/8-oxoguanine DNA glycosylase
MVEVRAEVSPPWPYRLPGGGRDGVQRRRGGVVERLLHVGDAAVLVRAAQPAADRVVLGAWAPGRAAADEALRRMRFALAVDDDLRPFHDRFARDPLIGRSVRARPWLRVRRRPEPFEALAWAICEQLIEFGQAAGIQRRLVRRLGRRCPRSGLRDVPSPAALAGAAPAELEACGLSHGRALALRRVAREVAAGRIDLRAGDHEAAWRRLRTIPGIGPWTVEMLALHGQGRYDQIPAADVGYLRLAGRLLTGDPRAKAQERDVRALFAPYAGWAGLAGAHALLVSLPATPRPAWPPRPAGTRSSAPRPGRAWSARAAA